jgi:DNA-binding MarR family transcriptional regulator
MSAVESNPELALPHVETDGGLKHLGPDSAQAWTGLLRTHRQITRALDAELEARHGLSFSALELLVRLAWAPQHHLRMSDLAERASLSLSRVSRIVDQLERRGAVERRACPTDARVVHAVLTGGGLELLRAAQETHFAGVERRFLGRLSDADVRALARIFTHLSPPEPGDC